jgi:hypothetical protein
MLKMLCVCTTGTRSGHFRNTVRAYTNSSGQWSLPARKLLLVQALLVWIEWLILVLIIAGRKKTSVE